MKKTLVYMAALLATAGATVACDDFLTESVKGQQNLDSYFSNAQEATSYLNGCYQALAFDDWWQVNNFFIFTDMCSDDMWMGNTSQSAGDYESMAHYQGTGATNNVLQNYWNHRYKGILRCNVAIDRLPDITFQDESLQGRFIGEAKFLRGYFYMELVKNFGGVPVIDGFYMPEEVGDISRKSAEEVWALVEQDFKDAAAVLPKEYSAADMGRATSGAALGLLMKAYVFQEKWKEATDTYEKLKELGVYELNPTFGDVWDMNNNNSKESLFEYQYIYDETYNLGGALSVLSGNRTEVNDGWAWGLPSSDLEKAYLEENDFERLKWTIIKTGATEIAGEPDFAELVKLQYDKQGTQHKDMVEGTYYVSPDVHKSARVSRKIYIPFKQRPETWDKVKIPQNVRILRWADVLLLAAEAYNEQGMDVQAQAPLNEVRNRVGRPNITKTGTELKRAIRTERRLELGCEYHRLYDIRRWESIDNPGHKVIADIMGPNGSFVKRNTTAPDGTLNTADPYEWNNQKEASDKGKGFIESRDLVFPIPQYEIDATNGSITQNPGWN